MLSTPRERRTVPALLEDYASRRPDRAYYTWDGAVTTVGQTNRAANVAARRLASLGVGVGTRVAVMMTTSPEYLTAWFALGKLGAVEVPINTAYKGELLAYQLRQARCEFIVIDEALLEGVAPVIESVETLTEVVVNGKARGRYRSLADLLTGAADSNIEEVSGRREPEDLACIMYTSGTTGPSKGVMLSRYGLAGFGFLYAEITSLVEDDVVFNYSPFHHVAGKFLAIGCLVAEAQMVLSDRFSVRTFWDDVRRDGVTNFVAIGGVCNMLCAADPSPADPDNPVRVVYAVPAPGQLYDEFESRFDLKLVEAYGSTEVGLVLSTCLEESIPGTCGRPNDFFDVRLFDERGNEVAAGESGEIVVAASDRLLMSIGYDGMPDKTEEAWRGGWFHTGDRATRDDEGRFWFQDRVKDSIRRQGENISSYEVERIVGGHHLVSECAALAAPSEVGEDEVRVVVVLREGASLQAEELFRYCSDHMAYFMVPRYIDIALELPRTPTAKVEKYKLRADGCTASTWDARVAGLRSTRSGIVRIGEQAPTTSGLATTKRTASPKEEASRDAT